MYFKREYLPIIITFIYVLILGCTSKGANLYKAATRGDKQEVVELIKDGADVNYRNRNGKTPLMQAISFSFNPPHKEIVKILIANGVDVNAQMYETNTTALHIAVLFNYEETVNLLIANNADVNATLKGCGYGRTLLMVAAESNFPNPVVSPQIAKTLIASGADVNAKDDRGMTALMYTVESGRRDIEKILRDYDVK